MSEEIKKEAQDAKINPEDLNQVAGGGVFDIIPSKKCLSCKRIFTVRQASTIVNNKCPDCGGTVVNYVIGG